MLDTVFWAVVVLGVLIFVHELGHFLLARWFGVHVEVFSLGFGPRVFGWRGSKDGTEYQLSAIPLGGYVKMLGESPDDEVAPEEMDRAFSGKKLGPRFAIVFAGPAFNFIFAVFALMAAYLVGVGEVLPVVGSVADGMPAKAAGIQLGDRITYIDDQPIKRWKTMSDLIKDSDGRHLDFTIERAGKPLLVTITPQVQEAKNLFGETIRQPFIGIGPDGTTEIVSYGFGEALAKGSQKTWDLTVLTVTSIWKLITQVVSADQIGGPLMIAELAGKTASQGMSSLLFFMALISINLGILNLLPIPILDGGHLFFFCIEAVKGGPVREKFQMMANRVGMALLLLLMAWAMKNDITRMFPMG